MSVAFARLENTPAETIRGIAVFVGASAMMPLFDALAKLVVMSYDVSPGEMALIRLTFQTFTVLPVLLWIEGPAALRVRHPFLQFLRGALLGVGAAAYFAALRFMPLADATAIFFVEPMIVTLLSALILGETIGWRRIAAVLVGFLGALIVIQPNFAAFGVAAALPVLTAACIALYLILSRRLSRTASPLAMLFYAGVGGMAVIACAVLAGDRLAIDDLRFGWPDGSVAWLLILGACCLGTVGHLMFIEAYRLAPASVLAPFGYMEIVSAVFLGFVMFGAFPGGEKWLGIAIIVGSGVFIYWRERVLSIRETKPPAVH